MSIAGRSFTFNGKNSESDFNSVLCELNGAQQTVQTALKYTLNRGEILPGRAAPNYYSAQFADTLQFEATIAKLDHTPYSQAEERRILSWLSEPLGYAPFTVADHPGEDYHSGVIYYARCTGIAEERPAGGNLVLGLTLSFTCSAPYGYSEERRYDFSCSSSASFTVFNDSDDRSADIWPIMEVKCLKTGPVTFCCQSDPAQTLSLSMREAQELIVDCAAMDITDNLGLFDYARDTNLGWICLAPGENLLTVTGECEGTVRFRTVRMVAI